MPKKKPDGPVVPATETPDADAPVSALHDREEMEALAAIGQEAQAAGNTEADQAQARQSMAETAALLALPLTVGFGILAPNWNITGSECEQMGAALAPLLEKYLPGVMDNNGPEMSAALVVLAILAPRVIAGTPRKLPPPEPSPDQGAA